MSESAAVSSGANALWQVHRFSSALLKAGGEVGRGRWDREGGKSLPVGRGRLFKNMARRGGGGRRRRSWKERRSHDAEPGAPFGVR